MQNGGQEVVESGVVLTLSSGMTASNVVVDYGGEVLLEGGKLVNPSFSELAIEVVASGGILSGQIVAPTLILSSGGIAENITAGQTLVFAGGTVSGLSFGYSTTVEI